MGELTYQDIAWCRAVCRKKECTCQASHSTQAGPNDCL